MDAFESIANPIFQKIRDNGREAPILTAVRDAILPKLMSGELCLRRIDVIAEASRA